MFVTNRYRKQRTSELSTNFITKVKGAKTQALLFQCYIKGAQLLTQVVAVSNRTLQENIDVLPCKLQCYRVVGS